MKKVLIFLSFSVFLFSAPYNENEMLVRRFYEKYNYIQEYEKEKHNEDIPRNELYLRMGIFYLFQKENDKEAEKYFFKSLNEDKNLDSYLYLGVIYYGRENYDQAEKYYLLAIKNEDVIAMKCLGVMYYELENDLLAEKYLKMASEYGDNGAMLYLANFYAILGHNNLAIKYFNKAVEAGNEEAIEMKKIIEGE